MEVCGEEAATAFLEACRPWNSDNLIDEVRKGLTAALPHLPGVGVKKLEWNEDPEENRWNSYHAFGQEQIIWDPRASEETSFGWFNCGKRVWFGSIDEAKAAAQADYSARILSALEPSAARELALEALNTAYASMEGSCSANHRIALNTVDAAIRALPSPDHADAGKVEGDGNRETLWKSAARDFGSYLALNGTPYAIDYWNECFGPLFSAPAVAGNVEGDGWLPIESAPKNRAIQIFIPNADYYGNDGVYAGILVDLGTGQRWATFGWAVARDLPPHMHPSHWRPLPSAPSEGAE